MTDFHQEYSKILSWLREAEIHQDIELPHIVVVGTQSAGKSSTIEAISTLQLPRGTGTCTRCPMEFRLENSMRSSDLSVDITLRFAEHREEVPFRRQLSDLDEIRQAISDAQERILNPTLLGIQGLGIPGQIREFSEDCVCVSAKGPNMHDLLFYDIPGVIQDVPDGQDPSQIDLIKGLVQKYVAKPDCIVLLVVTCEYDMENQGARRLIFNDENPDLKKRTVGVLTKADKMVDGTESSWLKTFDNQTHKLDSGWYAVKLPAAMAGYIPWEEAREQERRFFDSEEPWKSKVIGDDRSRLGSEQLAQYISRMLSNLVAARLPSISRKISDIIDTCDADLERLPIHTEEDAHQTILTLIDNFSKNFSDHIEGIPPKPFSSEVGLIFKVKEIFDRMMCEVCKSTPRFSPTNKPTASAEEPNSLLWKGLSAEGEIKYIDEVIETMKKHVTRELPGELPWGIIHHIITHFVENWQAVAMKGFKEVKEFAVDHFNGVVSAHFADYERGGLLSIIKEIVHENIRHCTAASISSIKSLSAMELIPATLLKAEYIELKTELYRRYRSGLDLSNKTSLWSFVVDTAEKVMTTHMDAVVPELTAGKPFPRTIWETLLQQLTASGKHDGNPQELAIDSDQNNGLIIMSSVQAYLELASKRFADVVSNFIDSVFFKQLDTRVRKALRALPLNASSALCLEMIQDPTIPRRRRQIKDKKDHYLAVKERLDESRRSLEGHASRPRLRNLQDSSGLYSPLDSPSPTLSEAVSIFSNATARTARTNVLEGTY